MSCLRAHQLLNELTIIAGQCEVLETEPMGVTAGRRVAVIRFLARQMAEDCRRCEVENFGLAKPCGAPADTLTVGI